MSPHLMGWVASTGRIDAPLGAGALVRVGAMGNNDVVVRVDGVSGTHARIVGEADGYWIEDANSRNGTWLNGRRVKRARLKHLDVITLGRFAELVFVERAAEAPAIGRAAVVRVRIEWLDGDRRGKIVDIPRGETLIGRAESCALMVDSPAISRAHARISNTGDRVVIEDLGSANGTAVDGRLLSTPAALGSGSEVTLGEQCRFRVLIDGATERPRTEVLGAVPARVQDMEWATRLVYSAADLEAIAGAAGGIDKPSPPAMVPVGKDPSPPIVPVPAPPAAAGEAAIAPPEASRQPRAVAASSEGTRVAGADLRLPGALEPEPPPDGATRYEPPSIGRPPQFSPAHSAIEADRTRLDGAVLKPPRVFVDTSAPAAPSEDLEGNKLPAATQLGVPIVGPPPSSLAATPADAAVTAWGGAAAKKRASVTSVEFSGDAGVFSLPRGTSTVGRSVDATMRIDNREISRIHAAVTVTHREVTVEDRNSANGTAVNGRVITGPTTLASGDRVSFAEFEFRVELTWTEGNGSDDLAT